MIIPEKFRQKVVRTNGEKGQMWLSKLPEIVDQCKVKWNLTNLVVSNIVSYNYMCFASSPTYGPVALKIGIDLRQEREALSLYQGRHICRCFDSDEELGALLLERINPGNDLTTVLKPSERINIAAELAAKLPLQVQEGHGFKTYSEWVERAFTRARREGLVGSQMLDYIDTAQSLHLEMNQPGVQQVFLHADLNHWNVLQDTTGQWKAIDPQGVVGLRALECARFIENERDMVPLEQRLTHIGDMITAFSLALGEAKRTITCALFIDTVLSTCWSFEENISPQKAMECVANCDLTWKYVKHQL